MINRFQYSKVWRVRFPRITGLIIKSEYDIGKQNLQEVIVDVAADKSV